MKKINYNFLERKKFINQTKLKGKEQNYNILRKILLSLMIISLSLTTLITASSALFTGEEEVKTHVVTGNLNFEFKRTNLIGETLNGRGFLEEFEDDSKVNLKDSGANAFSIKDMVPGATYKGTFNLVNTGSTAFDAKISFTNLENSNVYILKQIKVSFNYNEKNTTYSLIDFNKISLDLGILTIKDEVDFTISINLPSDTNNEAQNSKVNFDLRLDATQVLYKK